MHLSMCLPPEGWGAGRGVAAGLPPGIRIFWKFPTQESQMCIKNPLHVPENVYTEFLLELQSKASKVPSLCQSVLSNDFFVSLIPRVSPPPPFWGKTLIGTWLQLRMHVRSEVSTHEILQLRMHVRSEVLTRSSYACSIWGPNPWEPAAPSWYLVGVYDLVFRTREILQPRPDTSRHVRYGVPNSWDPATSTWYLLGMLDLLFRILEILQPRPDTS